VNSSEKTVNSSEKTVNSSEKTNPNPGGVEKSLGNDQKIKAGHAKRVMKKLQSLEDLAIRKSDEDLAKMIDYLDTEPIMPMPDQDYLRKHGYYVGHEGLVQDDVRNIIIEEEKTEKSTTAQEIKNEDEENNYKTPLAKIFVQDVKKADSNKRNKLGEEKMLDGQKMSGLMMNMQELWNEQKQQHWKAWGKQKQIQDMAAEILKMKEENNRMRILKQGMESVYLNDSIQAIKTLQEIYLAKNGQEEDSADTQGDDCYERLRKNNIVRKRNERLEMNHDNQYMDDCFSGGSSSESIRFDELLFRHLDQDKTIILKLPSKKPSTKQQ